MIRLGLHPKHKAARDQAGTSSPTRDQDLVGIELARDITIAREFAKRITGHATIRHMTQTTRSWQ